MKKLKFLTIFIFGLFNLCFASDESITVTTYYPSPYGSYSYLQTDKLGVGDNNSDGIFTNADVPTTSGDAWIKGRVGIGTNSPQAKLDISGPGASTEFFRVKAPGGFVFARITTDAANTPSFWLSNPSSLSTILLNTDGTSYFSFCNVAIGTMNAAGYRLNVVGTAGLSTGTAWTNTSDRRWKDVKSELKGSSLRVRFWLYARYPMNGMNFIISSLERMRV